ncbi:MAG: hypothetical protein P9F75_08185 [Candidatus Contendobacter sp.]|nr:hypothetical protein [Candidatus Contendobacter sp.]
MKFQSFAAIFVLTALLMLGMAYLDEGWLAGMAVVFTLSGVAVAVILLIWRYVYSGVLLGYHVGMAAFVTWVFINRELVVHEQMFVFSTFTDANLEWAIVTLVTASLAVFLPWMAFARGRRSLLRVSARSLAYELLGRLDRLPLKVFQLALVGSFIIGILFFITNTSVLDAPYPSQGQTQWVPWEIQKIPTLLAVSALAFAYVRRLRRGRRFAVWLLIAQVNFLIVTILMLFLMGSRGLFTFLWLGFGVLELAFWSKRRGSLGWGVLFVVLAWFAYKSWPYLRANLAVLPTDEVLVQALQIGLGLGSDVNWTYAGEDQIQLNDIDMVSTSLFHLLYVIQLIRDGISISGSTFINLIPQALPSWLDGVLWERPLNEAWLLGDYYYHGGGFLIVANAYWNGGLWVALVFMAVLTAIFVGFDRYLMRSDVGLLYRAVYWLWLPVMIVQMGYGIQGMVRVIQLLVAVILLERFWRRRIRRRGWPLGVQTASQPSPGPHSTEGTGK